MAVTWKRLLGVGDAATDLSSGAATTGQVLMADGSGGSSWQTRKYVEYVGDNSNTSFEVTHNFNSYSVLVAVWNTTELPYAELVLPSIFAKDANTIIVEFSDIPSAYQMRVVIMG